MSAQSLEESSRGDLADAAEELIASATESSIDVSTFFEKFELLLHVPDAINKLRRVIMKTAVQGRLVPQLPSEGTAESVLKQARQLKLELKESNKLRGDTRVRALSADVVPLVIPFSWRWVSFGDLLINRDGERIPVSREQRESKEKVYDYYGASGVIDKIDDFLFDKPLLLIGEDGANLINRSTPIAFMAMGKYWVNNHAHVLDGVSEDLLRYIELFINSISLIPYITGSAQPKMNQAKMNTIPIALPPLAEQKRIVAKVDELMGLCDRLETLEKERKERHAVLSRAALARFAETPSPINLQFLFQKAFDVEPAELRRVVLSAAVKGQLFGNTADLERSKVGDHIEFQNGYAFKSTWFKPEGIRLCRNMNVSHGFLDWRESAFVDSNVAEEFCRFSLNEDDIVLSLDRPLINTGLKVARLCSTDLPCLLLQRVARAIPKTHAKIDMSFFFLWLNSPEFTDTIDPGRSNGVPHISTRQVQQLDLTLPPLAEQKRIVAKVDELMSLVDDLERQLVESRSKGQQLMEAIVERLTAASAGSS